MNTNNHSISMKAFIPCDGLDFRVYGHLNSSLS